MNFKNLFNLSAQDFIPHLKANQSDYLSEEVAQALDAADPLYSLRTKFGLRKLVPFSGHSLGPAFLPGRAAIDAIYELQTESLHAGHFPKTESIGGNWFDFDISSKSIAAARAMLGFEHDNEFLFTQAGLSDNLRTILTTLVNLDFKTDRTKICHLGTEFISDQAVLYTLVNKQIQDAAARGEFLGKEIPQTDNHVLKIPANEQGLYDADTIIAFVKAHAHEIHVLHLSDIIANTGQRLNMPYILGALKDIIQAHGIFVGLDLAHTVGNRTINLRELEVVSYAVGCGYKFCSGTAGSPFGFYLSRDAIRNHAAVRGWKGMESDKVFSIINGFDPRFLLTEGAHALRASNPSPAAIAPTQTFLKQMAEIGWDNLVAKSERLTTYMIALLEERLGNHIQFITPIDPAERGAAIVFQVKGMASDFIERELLEAGFEIDSRPPNNLRITAHYGYIGFADIHGMVLALEKIVRKELLKQASPSVSSPSQGPGFFVRDVDTTGAVVVHGSQLSG